MRRYAPTDRPELLALDIEAAVCRSFSTGTRGLSIVPVRRRRLLEKQRGNSGAALSFRAPELLRFGAAGLWRGRS